MTLRALQCFSAGMHTAGNGQVVTFSELTLKQMATAYDPAKREAPLVLGHPDDDKPVYGQVVALVAHGPALFCVADVSNELMNLVRVGRYKNVSASFFQPDQYANPYKGAYYLKHVGLLGAVNPSIKGMQPVAFSMPAAFEDADHFDTESLSFSERDHYTYQQRSNVLHRVAKDLQIACPGIGLIDAVRHAEKVLK